MAAGAYDGVCVCVCVCVCVRAGMGAGAGAGVCSVLRRVTLTVQVQVQACVQYYVVCCGRCGRVCSGYSPGMSDEVLSGSW